MSSKAWLGLLFICACSAHFGGGGDGNSPTFKPNSPDEALKALSEDDRRAFEGWKASLEKSCGAPEVIGQHGDAASERGLDLRVLFEKTGNSLVVSSGPGEGLVLGSPYSLSGMEESTFASETNINGSRYRVEVAAKRHGSSCEVSIGGQVVYKSEIAQSMPVAFAWDTQKKIEAIEDKVGFFEVGELSKALAPLATTAWNALVVSNANEALGRRLNVSAKYFQGNAGLGAYALRLRDNSLGDFWISSSDQILAGPTSVLRTLFAPTGHTLALELRVPLRKMSFGDFGNGADQAMLRFDFSVDMKPVEGQAGKLSFQAKDLQYRGELESQPIESNRCLLARGPSLLRVNADPRRRQITPSFDAVSAPCALLTQESILEQSLKDGSFLQLLSQGMAAVPPAPQRIFSDWEQILENFALTAAEKNQDLSALLNPQGQSPALGTVAAQLQSLRDLMTPKAFSAEIRQGFYSMVLNWTLRNLLVDARALDRILRVVAKVSTDFPVSSQRLLLGLRQDPDSQESVLSFAESMDEPYRQEAKKAAGLAESLGARLFAQQIFDGILQMQPSLSELQGWSRRLSQVASALLPQSALQSVRAELSDLSLGWLSRGEAQPEELAGIFEALAKVKEPFPNSFKSLLSDLRTSLAAGRPALKFASEVTPAYRSAVDALKGAADAVEMSAWAQEKVIDRVLQDRPSLEHLQAMTQGLRGASAFTQRERARLSSDSFYYSMNEEARKELVTKGASQGWGAEDFETLDAAAALARTQSFYQDYTTTSRLLKSVGWDRFSAEPGKAFDPAFGHRYLRLYQEVNAYFGRLQPEFDFYSIRSSLTQKMVRDSDPLWRHCDNNAFANKQQALAQGIDKLVRADSFDRFRLTNDLNDNVLADCPSR